jgi:methyl-accepting chemotaxis protein
MASSIQEVNRRVHESNKIASEAVKRAEDTNTQVMELSDAAGQQAVCRSSEQCPQISLRLKPTYR